MKKNLNIIETLYYFLMTDESIARRIINEGITSRGE